MGQTNEPGEPHAQPETDDAPPAADPADPPGGPTAASPPAEPRRSRLPGRVPPVVAGVAVALVALAVALVVLTRGDDASDDARSRRRTAFERRVEEARSEDDPDDIRIPDPEPPDDLGDDPLSDRLADECFDGDPSSCDELFRDSFLGSEYEKYGSTCGERTKRGQAGSCTALYPDPDYAELRRACGDGDDGACDELYADAPRRSVDEHFGSTCGGRSEDELVGDCEADRS